MFDGTFFNFLTKKSTDSTKDNRFDIDDHSQDIAGQVRSSVEHLNNPSSMSVMTTFNAGNLY